MESQPETAYLLLKLILNEFMGEAAEVLPTWGKKQ